MTIFIESAVLYAPFAITSLATTVIINPLQQVFIPLLVVAHQVATYLIVYRLADGTAWQKDTLQKKVLSTIKFTTAHAGQPRAVEGSGNLDALSGPQAPPSMNDPNGTTSAAAAIEAIHTRRTLDV